MEKWLLLLLLLGGYGFITFSIRIPLLERKEKVAILAFPKQRNLIEISAMNMLFITLLVTCCLVSTSAVGIKNVQRVKAHVMIMYSGSGSLVGISDTYTVSEY